MLGEIDVMYGLHHDVIYRQQILFSFPLFINSKELTYFQISEVLHLNSQTQFIITFTIEVGVIKFVVIVIFGLTFA